MTTATTRQGIRRELYNRIPGLGFSGTADSLTGATLTDTYVFKDATTGPNAHRGQYLYRPDRSGDDLIRKIVSHVPSTGVVTVHGSAYSNTSDTNYEVIGLIHPDELNACIVRALNYVYLQYQDPLCGDISDGDMSASTTTAWTASGGNTLNKITTASLVFSGFRALGAVNANANEYAESVSVRVFPNRPFYASTVVHSVSGTGSLVVRDQTNSATVGSAVTSAENGWAHLWVTGLIPSGCETITLRLTGVESDAYLVWNHALFYQLDNYRYLGPTYLDEQFKFLKLREARYMHTISSQTNGGYDDANSLTFHDWHQPSEFSLDPFHKDANPYVIQLRKSTPRQELWVQGQRPYSDLDTLSTDSSTTLAPIEQVYAHAILEVAKVLRKRYPADKRWMTLLEEANLDVAAQDQSRPETPMRPVRREEHLGRI